jgi:hypothetical protein
MGGFSFRIYATGDVLANQDTSLNEKWFGAYLSCNTHSDVRSLGNDKWEVCVSVVLRLLVQRGQNEGSELDCKA